MPLFTLSSLTCHRFIITSITVSSKALCDVFCTNNLYARVGGVNVTELNMLEREFLAMINWRLSVSILIFCLIMTFRAQIVLFFFCNLSATATSFRNTMSTSYAPTALGTTLSSDPTRLRPIAAIRRWIPAVANHDQTHQVECAKPIGREQARPSRRPSS